MFQTLASLLCTPRSAILVALAAVLLFNAGYIPGGYQPDSGVELYLEAGHPLMEAFSALRREAPLPFEIGLRARLHVYTLVRFVREMAPAVISGDGDYGFLSRLYMFSARLYNEILHRRADPLLIQEALDIIGLALRERLENEKAGPQAPALSSAALPLLEALAAAADATEATVILREALAEADAVPVTTEETSPGQTAARMPQPEIVTPPAVSSRDTTTETSRDAATEAQPAALADQTVDALLDGVEEVQTAGPVRDEDEDLALPGDGENSQQTSRPEAPADAWAGLYRSEKEADRIINSLEIKLDFLQ